MPLREPIEHRVTIELARETAAAVGTIPVMVALSDERGRVLAEAVAPPGRFLQAHLPASRTPAERRLHLAVWYAADVPPGLSLDAAVARVSAEALRPDVVPLPAGFRIGRGGWYNLEEDDRELFRWVRNDAEVVVTDPLARTLVLDVAPGPALRGRPLALDVLDAGEPIARFSLEARRRIALDLPSGHTGPYRLVLHVAAGGTSLPGSQRVLNFRAFHIPPIADAAR